MHKVYYSLNRKAAAKEGNWGYSGNLLRSIGMVIVFGLGICFGIVILKVAITLDYDSTHMVERTEKPADMLTEQNKLPEPDQDKTITKVTEKPKNVPANSERTAGIEAANERQVDKLQELVEITTVLRKELEEMKAKHHEDQMRISNLTRQPRQTRNRTQEIVQAEPSQEIPESVPDKKAVVPAPRNSRLEEGLHAYESGNYEAAMKLLSPLATRGDSLAQFHIAMMYRNGLGILANNTIALGWMIKAARQGRSEAQIELARFYANGINGVQDPFLAYAWFLVAEKNGTYRFIDERTAIEGKLQKEMLPQAAALATQLQNRQVQASVTEAMSYQ